MLASVLHAKTAITLTMSTKTAWEFHRRKVKRNALLATSGKRWTNVRWIKDLTGRQRAAHKRWLLFYRKLLAEEQSGLDLGRHKPTK
jgi:hypothetical protein